jgi:parvulin-like peptidyl-prolyl isomerase
MPKFALCLILLAACTTGCKTQPAPPDPLPLATAQAEILPPASGGFVLAVGGQTITTDQILTDRLLDYFKPIAQKTDLERFKTLARPQLEQILAAEIVNVILYNQAKAKLGEDAEERLDKLADEEVIKFVLSFGADRAKAEQAIKQMGMDWAAFKDYQKKMIVSQTYIASQMPETPPITYSELVAAYNEMKDTFTMPATITFRLIDIEPSKLQVNDPNLNRLEQAGTLADELVSRINSGEDFAKLAEQYSNDHRASFGGLWKPVNPDSLAEPYDVLAAQAEKLQPGQIAGPIEAEGHIFIMKLEEKQPQTITPLEKVQKEVEAKINFQHRKDAVDKLTASLVEQAASSQRREFIEFCLEKIYRVSQL